MTIAKNMVEFVVGGIFVIVLAVIFFLAAVSDYEASFTDHLYYFEWDGHQYVSVDAPLAQRVLTHSPNCKCLKGEK